MTKVVAKVFFSRPLKKWYCVVDTVKKVRKVIRNRQVLAISEEEKIAKDALIKFLDQSKEKRQMLEAQLFMKLVSFNYQSTNSTRNLM